MRDIYLLRHGQVASSRPWRFLGQGDATLTDEGRAQMREWGEAFAGKPLAGILCSDLERCRESADIILDAGAAAVPTVDPGIREICLGEWEGLTVAEVEEKFPGAYRERGLNMGGFVPSGGESFLMLQQRALAALERAIARCEGRDGPLLAVTHIGVCRVVVAHILQIPLPAIFYLEQRFGRAHHIRLDKGRYSIAGLNLPAKAVGMTD